MNKINIGVVNSKVALISDDRYYDIVKRLCLRARRRIFASLFIIDLVPVDNNNEISVLELLFAVQSAVKRGVDVRLIIGGSKNSFAIQDKTETTLKHCQELKIPCQLIALSNENSSHKKLVVVDDRVIIGSHNWSHGAFTGQIQDSVLMEDSRLSSFFADEISAKWRKLNMEEKDV